MSPKPKFVNYVWVGYISDLEFVVFDPDVTNLYLWENGVQKISLWVEKASGWMHFDLEECKKELKQNLSPTKNEDRERVSNRYWSWKCGSLEPMEDAIYVYGEMKNESESALSDIELESEAWIGRVQRINKGVDPNE